MTDSPSMFELAPFALDRAAKEPWLVAALADLTRHHRDQCPAYRRMLDGLGFDLRQAARAADFPFLPVRLFKEMDLRSVPADAVFKTMTSSGTTGQTRSIIALDRETAGNQQKALVKIVADFLGPRRLPMLILDCPSVVKDRALFSARGAGILGFSIFGTERLYALDDASPSCCSDSPSWSGSISTGNWRGWKRAWICRGASSSTAAGGRNWPAKP